ncbi:MAG: ABC transporter ATP-binding protein [Rubrobacteraceae bacterium]
MGAVIETSGLTKTYGKDRGIKNVNLTVNEGEVFGFLGPNGAGKTTTIRTLLGFMKPTGGRAEVFGMDIEKDSVAIRSMIGNLPGEFALEDRMTGDQLLKFFARLRGVKNLDYAYEIAGRIDADLKRPMRRLSRGNKQKIGLVQAMFHKPPLLILDEPTGGLDPLVQEEFLKIIGEVKEEGRTVFFSSHTLNEVERICDRVGIICEGELTAVENTNNLINRSFRHVNLIFAEELGGEEVDRFENLEGVDKFSRDGAELPFDLHGNLDDMIKLAARHELVDMMYERPSLEEIFLAYYSGDGKVRDTDNGSGEAGAWDDLDRGTQSASENSREAAAGTRSQGASYSTGRDTGRGTSHNSNGATAQTANVGTAVETAAMGSALQQAVEAIVEQTVERTIDRIVEKGEK